MLPPIPSNEVSRIAALRTYDILDTVKEEIFDSVTRAAAKACSTSMAALSFIDTDRQWFKSTVGLSVKEIKRNVSFCAHAINGHELFIVEDTIRDMRFQDNPEVVSKPHVRFYAAVPLVSPNRLSIGTLCVFDTVPRRLSVEEARILNQLAESTMSILNLRHTAGAAVYAKAVDMSSDGLTIAAPSPDGFLILHANESFLRFTGCQYHEAIGQSCTFPTTADSPNVGRALEEASAKGVMTTVDCHFQKKNGEMVWDRISFVPYVDQHDKLLYMAAVHRDISYVKEAEVQAQQLHAMRTTLSTVDHVVKNFMNAAQLYSFQTTSGSPIDPKTQQVFDAALQQTRLQLAAINQMETFKDRATPFGISLLDAPLDSLTSLSPSESTA